MSLEIITVAAENSRVVEPELLAAAEMVHCQLRPHLAGRYGAAMQRVVAGGGEMCVAREGERIRGVAVFRVYENTSQGKHLYVDDLVTDEAERSRGVGRMLLDYLTGVARRRQCTSVVLDSGTHRTRAHAFYFREGFTIRAFHFIKPL